jgi:glycosyltransferase 2 family protein
LKNQINEVRKKFPTKLLLRLAGTGIALFILLSVTDAEKLAQTLSNADAKYLISAFLITITSPFLTSFRLKIFLSATGTKVTYNRCLVASLCGLSLNLILPARGGDLVKLAYLRNKGEPSWPILAGAALLERGFDVLALGLIGLTASLLLGLQNAAIAAGFVVTATTLGLLLLPRMGSLPFVGKKAGEFAAIIKKTSRRKLYLLGCLSTCCLCWIANSVIMGFLVKAFDNTVSITHAFSATPPSIIAGIAPVSLWGVGTRDGALAYFLQGVTPAENAISAGFLYTALVYWLLGLIGLPALFFAKRKTKVISNESSASNALRPS